MIRLATEIYSFVALASLWNFLAGYAGLVSVGQQTFVGSAAIRFICAHCGRASIRWSACLSQVSSAR